MSKRHTLAGTTPLVDPAALDSTLDRALGAHKMFEQTFAIQDAILPRSMRQMLDLQASLGRFANPFGSMDRLHEKIARMSDPLGVARFAGFAHRDFGRASSAFALSESLQAVTGAFQMQRDLLGMSKLFDIAKGLEGAVGRAALHNTMTPFMKLDRALGSTLDTGLYTQWQGEFTKTVAPSLGLLGMEWQRPVGVLAMLATPELGASMSWTADETSAVAALLPQQASRSEITIEVSITCAFCGNAMITDEHRFRWKGNRKGLLDVSIVPICAECQRCSNEDPTYLSRMLRKLEAPALRVITTGGSSDGIPRGKLRLVQDDRDED